MTDEMYVVDLDYIIRNCMNLFIYCNNLEIWKIKLGALNEKNETQILKIIILLYNCLNFYTTDSFYIYVP